MVYGDVTDELPVAKSPASASPSLRETTYRTRGLFQSSRPLCTEALTSSARSVAPSNRPPRSPLHPSANVSLDFIQPLCRCRLPPIYLAQRDEGYTGWQCERSGILFLTARRAKQPQTKQERDASPQGESCSTKSLYTAPGLRFSNRK